MRSEVRKFEGAALDTRFTEPTQVHEVLGRLTSRAALAALTVAALAAACDSATEPGDDPPAGGAVVTFAFDGHPADTLRVHVLDPATIAAARAYVATRSGPAIPIGPIRRGAGADTRYPFHFLDACSRVRMKKVASSLPIGAGSFDFLGRYEACDGDKA